MSEALNGLFDTMKLQFIGYMYIHAYVKINVYLFVGCWSLFFLPLIPPQIESLESRISVWAERLMRLRAA